MKATEMILKNDALMDRVRAHYKAGEGSKSIAILCGIRDSRGRHSTQMVDRMIKDIVRFDLIATSRA